MKARGGRAETLEGDFECHRVVLVEFDDYDTAKKWWDSEDYREFKSMRQRAADSTLILVDGIKSSNQ